MTAVFETAPHNYQVNNLPFEQARRKLNLIVIRSACLEVDGKTPERISLADVFGYMDALDYLILLLSLAAALSAGFLFGMIVLSKWPEPSFLGTAVIHFQSSAAFLDSVLASLSGVVCFALSDG